MPVLGLTKEKSRVFPAVGRCIYCGSDGGGVLTKEHIYPKGLGGGLILPEATCTPCQTKIGLVEDACMRRTLLPFRIASKLAQNPKNRPPTVPLLLDLELRGPTSVAVEDHPEIVVMPGLRKLPGILENRPRERELQFDYKIFGVLGLVDEMKQKLRRQRHVGINLDGIAWIRMLAKIAHGYAVAELGLAGFSHMLPDLILARDLTLCSHLVGRCPEPWPIPDKPPLAMIDRRKVDVDGQHFVAVIIRLFAELGPETPAYAVIAGTPCHQES